MNMGDYGWELGQQVSQFAFCTFAERWNTGDIEGGKGERSLLEKK